MIWQGIDIKLSSIILELHRGVIRSGDLFFTEPKPAKIFIMSAVVTYTAPSMPRVIHHGTQKIPVGRRNEASAVFREDPFHPAILPVPPKKSRDHSHFLAISGKNA